MFCPNCGKEIADGSYACAYCGAVVANNAAPATPVYNAQPQPEYSKAGTTFAKLSFVFGLISFIGAFIPFLNYVTWELAIVAIIFSIIAKKKNIPNAGQAKKGMTFGILGLVLGFVFMILVSVIIGIIAAIAGSGEIFEFIAVSLI